MIKKNKYINNFDISAQMYFKDISQFKPLTQEEEVDLWKKYKYNNDLSARDKIVKSNLKFVASIAKGYQGRGLSYSDLIAEGNCGLLRALEKFDYRKGFKTISYSVWWIRQAILEAIRDRNGLNGEELPMDFEKQHTDDEEIYEAPIKSNSFIDNEENNVSIEDLKEAISALTSCLNKREFIIITKYFGLDGESLTLDEIGQELNLTKERVRQLKELALRKLRTEALLNSITSDIYK